MTPLSAHQFRLFLRRLTAFLIVANAPFWVAQHLIMKAPRGQFNLDYLLLAIVALYLPVTPGIAAFILVFCLDAFSCASIYYYFNYFNQTEWLVAALFFSQLPPLRLLSIVLGLVFGGWMLGMLCWKIAGDSPAQDRRPQAALLSITLCILLAASLGASPAFQGASTPQKPSSSALYRAGHSLWGMLAHGDKLPTQPIDSASHALGILRVVSTAPSSPPHNIVLILVESYGLLRDPAAAQRLNAPYRSALIRQKYQVETGTTPFRGSTVAGEFRELCGVSGGLSTTSEAARLAPKCLPAILKSRGFQGTAFHGFTQTMFDRVIWYRDLGFEKRIFREQLGQAEYCEGAFPGTCDTAVGELIHRQLLGMRRPQFIYWLTLNSHLPVPTGSGMLSQFGCASTSGSAEQLCVWRGLVQRVHAEVAAMASDPALPPTEFLVVGDHAPPFLTDDVRSQFSQGEVPFIHLFPRELNGTTPQALLAHVSRQGSLSR